MIATQPAIEPPPPDAPSLGSLHREVAHLSHGRTAVMSPDGEQWAQSLEEYLERPVGCIDPQSPTVEAPFRTVVIAEAIEPLDATERVRLLESAWTLVGSGGRLVVVAANGECQPRHQPGRLLQRNLKKLLRPLGRPVAATNQPFAWLVMHVRKRHARTRPPNSTRDDRYRVTAQLCRGRVLELGCGQGFLSRAIRDRGHEVVGVDINGDKIRMARKSYPDITFIERNILDLGFPDEGFDTVVIAEVLEHVTDTVSASILDFAWRQVRPGGRLVASVPNGPSIPHPNHIRQFDRRSLAQLLQQFGTPHLSTAQPFKWLLMHVDKPR